MPFPTIESEAHFESLFEDDATWLPGVEAILAREGLKDTPYERMPQGSNLVYGVGPEHILKICPPISSEEAGVEFSLLDALSDQACEMRVPRLMARGTLHGWRYGVIERLPGDSLQYVWPELDHDERRHVLLDLRAWMARFARSRAQSVTLPAGRDNWARTQRALREDLVAKHARRGLDPFWCDQIARMFDDFRGVEAHHIVHADLHFGNLLATQHKGRWRMSAVIDFADALVAPHLYDLSAPLISMACGDADLVRALCGDPPPAHVLTQWLLLHRFSHLRRYLSKKTLQGCRDLDHVARALVGDVKIVS